MHPAGKTLRAEKNLAGAGASGKEEKKMGFVARIFGNPKKEIPVARDRDYKGSLEETLQKLQNSSFETVKLASRLLGIMGKWLDLFAREELLQKALSKMNNEEKKCLNDFFPEFMKND